MKAKSLVALDLKFLKNQQPVFRVRTLPSDRPATKECCLGRPKISSIDITSTFQPKSIQNKSTVSSSLHSSKTTLNEFQKFFLMHIEPQLTERKPRESVIRLSVNKTPRPGRTLKSVKKVKKVHFNDIVEYKDRYGNTIKRELME